MEDRRNLMDEPGECQTNPRVLLFSPYYPHNRNPLAGAFSRNAALALRDLGASVTVVAPVQKVPWPLRQRARWKSLQGIRPLSVEEGLRVYRPHYTYIPRARPIAAVQDGIFKRTLDWILESSRECPYIGVLAFDVLMGGGVAWRIAQELGVPALGWALGTDVRLGLKCRYRSALRTSLQQLRAVFYQTSELRAIVAESILEDRWGDISSRHVVRPHGIPLKQPAQSSAWRDWRGRLNIGEHEEVVLFLGRVTRDKGALDLPDILDVCGRARPNLRGLIVGAVDGADESRRLRRALDGRGITAEVVPAVPHSSVGGLLAAADIYLHLSRYEGTPNSLLEAMWCGTPCVAYDIPAIREVEGGEGGVALAASFSSSQVAEHVVNLLQDKPAAKIQVDRARKTVAERYDMEKSMASVLTLFGAAHRRVSER